MTRRQCSCFVHKGSYHPTSRDAFLDTDVRLAGPHGDGRHPYVNADGAFVGGGVPLLERDALGQWRPRDEAVIEWLLAAGFGVPFRLDRRYAQLEHVARALNQGNLALACISLVRMQLPPLPSAAHARAMADADEVLAKENPNWEHEPRVPAGNPDGGQWTDQAGDEGDETGTQPVAGRADDTQARKERFIDAHLSDAAAVARQFGIPVENIIGVSAVESGWGTSRFAREGNNYFGIHYPAPFASGYMVARDNRVKVATFASYADSLRSFTATAGSLVRQIADPDAFATALYDSGKFGVGNRTYARDLARTIRSLRLLLDRRRI